MNYSIHPIKQSTCTISYRIIPIQDRFHSTNHTLFPWRAFVPELTANFIGVCIAYCEFYRGLYVQ
jgi:hypothetical protein